MSEQQELDTDIQEAREEFLGVEFDSVEFDLQPSHTIKYATLCGETQERFLDENHPDFQAPPTFVASLSGGRYLPEGYPRFGGVSMDAGKGVESLEPIRPPLKLIGKSHIHDIFTKTGRSGRMVFTVTRLEFYTEDGIHVANSDSRQVSRERG